MEQKEYKIENIFKTLFVILIIILVFYGLTILITKNKENNKNLNEVTIQYEEILIGNMFEQNENEYYVLAQLSIDDSKLYNAVYNYQKKDKLNIYKSNLNNAFNQQYLKSESNFELEFPIFKESTLLKIKDKKIVEYFEGVDSILKILE